MSTKFLPRRIRLMGVRHTRMTFIAAAVVLIAMAILASRASKAANPASGALNPTTGTSLSWDGNATGGSSANGEGTCVEGVNCDTYTLNVGGTPAAWAGKMIYIKISWTVPANDYDLNVHKDSNAGPLVHTSASGAPLTSEQVAIQPSVSGRGVYTVHVVYFSVTPQTDQYHGTATVLDRSVRLAPQASGSAGQYVNYPAPNGLGNDPQGMEPSIGVNWNSEVPGVSDGGTVLFQASLQTLRVKFSNNATPATSAWEDVSSPNTALTSLDAILFTDHQTGRTFVSQLTGQDSLAAFSDNDGGTTVAGFGTGWTPSQGGGIPSGIDHQTIGGGRYAGNLATIPHPAYANAVYYCSQENVTAFCARSDDGGLTFGPGIPLYVGDCGGIHGHVKVSPSDGTVYVPNHTCANPGIEPSQGVAVSEDSGITWVVRRVIAGNGSNFVANSSPGDWDPSVGLGQNGTVYFGYKNIDGTAHMAVSIDRGRNWVKDFDVGAAFNIAEIAFPAVVAGDDDRAVMAFLGTTGAGGPASQVWHLYVAHTYDRGASYTTTDLTPNDPVQIGGICSAGLGCGSDRNLLDFMDTTIDKQGRVLVGYADGCLGCTNATSTQSVSALATIARECGGRGLLAQYDSLLANSACVGGNPSPSPTPSPTPIPSTGTFYFHGTPADQANKQLTPATPSNRGTATFDQNSPAGTVPDTQTTTIVATTDYVGNALAAYWRGPYSGVVNGQLQLNWFWSTPNAAAILFGGEVEVSVFADPEYIAARVQPQHLIGRATVTLANLTPVPTQFTSTIPVNGAINGELLIQVVPHFVDAGHALLIHYDSVSTPSRFSFGTNATPTPTPTPSASPTPTPSPSPTPTPGSFAPPRYFNYYPPSGVAEDFGEPSIGVNWKTGNVMFFGGFSPYAVRAKFDDCSSPARVTWTQTALRLAATPRVYGDPILFTDRDTGRTFVSQLFGLTPFDGMDFSDDDGANYLPSQGSGLGSGVDHQTVGSGPFHTPVPTGAAYSHAVYYCAQEGLNSGGTGIANCALSVNGGVTFGPAVPVYALGVNSYYPLHGHIKIAPDGTAYLPNRKCGAGAGMLISEDNGITWAARSIPDSSAGTTDPSIGIASDGTIFLGYEAADGQARIAVSHDKGTTWVNHTDVGTQLGLQNAVFPAVVAGDGNERGPNTARAAFAFYGSTSPGDRDNPAYRGNWYLFIASTFDDGKTWTTVNATPNDPMQRDGICTNGVNGCLVPRNLLDFFDATVDKEGRVLVGYQDGCMGDCVTGGPNLNSKKGVIARQSGGLRMFAANDPIEPARPGAPQVSGTYDSTKTQHHLSWLTPDNGGSPITGYKVYRRAGSTASYVLLATLTQNSFTDNTFNSETQNSYRVTAVNSVGEGPACGDFMEFVPAASVATACAPPGIMVVNDTLTSGADDDSQVNTPGDPRVNIKSLSVAEPFLGAGVNKLVFTLKVAPSTTLTTAPPSSQWFIIWNRQAPLPLAVRACM